MFFLRDSSLKFWENTSQIHSVPCTFGWPSSNIFPKKFHSTTFNGGIGSLSIQINGNYGWSRNKNALMPRFQLRWLYFFWTSPKVQTYPRIPAQLDLLVCWGEIQECVQCSVPFTHLCRACFPPAVWHISHNFFPSCTIAHRTVVWLCTANNIIDKAMLLKYNTTSCCSTYLWNNVHFSDTPCFYWFWSCITHTTYLTSTNSLRIEKTCNWKFRRTIGTTTTSQKHSTKLQQVAPVSSWWTRLYFIIWFLCYYCKWS